MSHNGGHQEYFTSRWGLLLATLGMCVGTGNIWRFPRMVAQNGGGSFVVAWMVFLFTWSIPLLIVEFAIGRKTRSGLIGAFHRIAGGRLAWMGAFVALCSSAIMFYYSVVTGWCVKYLLLSATGSLAGLNHSQAATLFKSFTSSAQPLLFHLIALGVVCLIIHRGVVAGIERASRIVVPVLFLILAVAAVRALFMPGATRALTFLFVPEWGKLGDYRVWLQGLTQSAWSTGAGWGLLLTYAIYAQPDHGPVRDSFLAGLGNNLASILAAVAIFCTIFAVSPDYIERVAATSNTGLAFEWMPELFNHLPASRLVAFAFFLTLTFAAISSFISMAEMATRVLVDLGLERGRAVLVVGGVVFLFGLPSALSMSFLENQDWTWSIGLMFSGLFVALAAVRFGIGRFREEVVNVIPSDWRVGSWFGIIVGLVVPAEFVAMTGWCFYQVIGSGGNWLNPLAVDTVGTCLLQIGVAIVVLMLLTRRMESPKCNSPS